MAKRKKKKWKKAKKPLTEQEFLALVAQLPEKLQAIMARYMWWDHADKKKQSEVADVRRYPEGMPLLKELGLHFEIGRPTVDITEDELYEAMILCGYTEHDSRFRAHSYAVNNYVREERSLNHTR